MEDAGADERGAELQPSVRRRAAVDSMTVRSTEAGGAGAAERGGPTDETGQAGGEAAGRLPGAFEAQDP